MPRPPKAGAARKGIPCVRAVPNQAVVCGRTRHSLPACVRGRFFQIPIPPFRFSGTRSRREAIKQTFHKVFVHGEQFGIAYPAFAENLMEQVFFFFVIVGFDGEDTFQPSNVRIAVVFQMAHSAFKIAYVRNTDFI